ncbi:transporter substrate-binding domain-containing protein [Pseudodesulfovibrio sp.]|uniref:substrate-binding periplasmic protein n=1 Tax=Pseudodesulfovibrio sp. TaxID=2035812 RepID=UPI002622498F|nr:transporter substrate-binding domain-containing protein [Pseudodesulfovibrio sp.]MDD3311355.1 transporter substrate-binding domain-containing protein [Pseudodesulfovibrio sp.]
MAAAVLLALILVSAAASSAEPRSSGPDDPDGMPILVFSTFESRGMSRLFGRILKEAYARLGYEAAFLEVPAERALVMANQGRVDGEAGRVPVIEPRCPNLIRVPTSLYTNRVVAFVRKDGVPYVASWGALAQYRIGAVLGYKFVDKMTMNMNRTLVSDYAKLFNMLTNCRIDVAVVEYLDVLPSLRSLDLKAIRLLQPPLAFNPMYHYLHKRHADLVPRLDRVLRDMQREGRMVQIQREMENELGGMACPMTCPVHMNGADG